MSNETMITKLLTEAYRAGYDENFIMDTRRIKRLIRLDENSTETLNRCAIAYTCSGHRRITRRRRGRS
jgi:hypothetical protein